MNINRMLQNAARNDLIGHNLIACGSGARDLDEKRQGQALRTQGGLAQAFFGPPSPGLAGVLILGHHLDVEDALLPRVLGEDGGAYAFTVTRSRWTPAFMDSHYRSRPRPGSYPLDGLLGLRERKCVTQQDVFVSELTLQNDSREAVRVRVAAQTPFAALGDGLYRAHGEVLPRALGASLRLEGFFALETDAGIAPEVALEIAPMRSVRVTLAFAFDPRDPEAARQKARGALAVKDPFAANEEAFNRWFAQNVPTLSCEDQDILRLYYYRWFLVKKNTFSPSDVLPGHFLKETCVYESAWGRWYGAPVGLSVPLQIDEALWMRAPDTARAQIGHWVAGQGNYRGYIQYTPLAAWRAYLHFPDQDALASCYPAMKDYALSLLGPEEADHIPPTLGSWVTGAEYQPSFYQHATPPWDWRQDSEGVREGLADAIRGVYRVDAFCFALASVMAVARMARALEEKEDAKRLEAAYDRLLDGLVRRHWDGKLGVFVDLDAETGKPCDEAVGYGAFLPLFFQGVDAPYTDVLARLTEEKSFSSGFSAATVSKQCPMYWPDNCIAGPCASSEEAPHRYGCCWNGPVWPYANGLITQAMGEAAVRDARWRGPWLAFFSGFCALHFLYGDPSVPDIVEHYRGFDGAPFSNVNDYFHSTWLAPFLRYWAGIRVEAGEMAFDPFTDMDFTISGVSIAGETYTFSQRKGKKEATRAGA